MAAKDTTFYDRHGLKIALLGCALIPFFVYAGIKALLTNSNEVKDWLPAHYVETTEFQWFRRYFPNEEFVLVTWEGCTLDDPRLDNFVEQVGRFDTAGSSKQPRFPRVVTGRTALSELQTAYPTLTTEEAAEKLQGSLVGPDKRQTCAIVSLTDEARRDVHRSLSLLRDATKASGVPAEEIRLGGTPVVNAAIDRVSSESLTRVLIVCCVVVSFIAWCLIRNLGLMILILVTGLYAAAVSLTALWITGTPMNAILITMIPMVYVAATSGSIHMCNYFVESVREEGVRGAASRAVKHAWVPLGLATATTAAGLLSICYTDLALIRTFGIYSAIGVVLSWVLLVVWLPAALTVWGWRGLPTSVAMAGDLVTEEEHETGEATLPRFWQRLGSVVTGNPNWFAGSCLVVLMACIPSLQNVNVSIDFMKEFRADSEIVRTYVWLEEKLGALMPMEVVVRINQKSELTMVQRMRLVERLQRRFETIPDVGGSISVATYAPDVDTGGPNLVRQVIRNQRLQRDRSQLLTTGFLAEGEGEELWRISVRVAALREVNYADLVRSLKQQVELEFESNPDLNRPDINVTYTGIAHVLFRARQSLVDGLYWGILIDLVLIVITVGLLMRHWSSGLLMTLTSLFPTIVVLGMTGWLGLRLDLGAIMAPCVALGVTVDDVIHFLLWFRTGMQRGLSQRDAVLLAWRACVRPMYQSWALLGLGMGCLVISDFLPILEFGMIMTAMLTVGLIGNLIFLPSLLAGPLGRAIADKPPASQKRKAVLLPEVQT